MGKKINNIPQIDEKTQENIPLTGDIILLWLILCFFGGLHGFSMGCSLILGVIIYTQKTKKNLKFKKTSIAFFIIIYLIISYNILTHLTPECYMNGEKVNCTMLLTYLNASHTQPYTY